MARARLQQGAAWLARRMKEHNTVAGTYSTGATSQSLTGWWANRREEIVNPGGTRARVASVGQQFCFAASDLTIVAAPEKGHRFTDGTRVYELRPNQNGDAFEYGDNAGQTIIRANLQQVS